MFSEWCLLCAFILLSRFEVALCDFEILILHTNDMHARFDETDEHSNLITDPAEDKPTFGGFARLKTAVDEARAAAAEENIPSLFLNAGDTFQGTPFYTLQKEEVVADLLPLLGIDVMSLGNHEFDDGPEVLARFLEKARIPTVAANVDFTNVPVLRNSSYLAKSEIREINGVKIGIVGYLTPYTKSSPSAGETTFIDEIESIRTEARKLKDNDVSIVIALGHSGINVDMKIGREVADVSLVIGGHTHTFLFNPPDTQPSTEVPEGTYPVVVEQTSGKKVPVVTAYAHTKYLGKLWITFDDNGTFISARPESNAVLIDSKIRQDKRVQDRVSWWRSKINAQMLQVLGQTKVYLDGWRASCKILECNLGNMLTDSFIDYVTEKYNGTTGWTDAPIAIASGKSIKMSRDPNKVHGNMTYDEILMLLPRKDKLYKLRMKGSTLKAALEHSVIRYDGKYHWSAPNEFLQVSGVHVTFDVSKPPQHRVVMTDVRCGNCTVPKYAPLRDDEVVVVITHEFLADGGHGYSMLKTETLRREKIAGENGEEFLSDTDCLARFIRKYKVVYPEISGRIIVLNANSTSTASSSISLTNSPSKYSSLFSCVFVPILVEFYQRFLVV